MKKDYKKCIILAFLLVLTYSVTGQSILSESKYGAIISNYITDSSKASKLSSTDLEDIYVNKEMFSKKTGIANVYLNQRYKGIKIFNAISSVGIKNDKVFYFADKFETNLSDKINTENGSITPSQAVSRLANHFNLGNVGNLEVLEESDNKVLFSKGDVSQENISVEKVYFKDKDGLLKLSWNLNIYTLDSQHWWSARVDAITGEILDINDWVVSCSFGDHKTSHTHEKKNATENKSTFSLFRNSVLAADGSQYNVLALPTETPDDGPFQIVSDPSSPLASEFGWHDDDGIAGAEYTTTQGNNVIARIDDDDSGDDGFMPDGGASLNFNFPIDLNTEAPSDYQDVATTQLFYMNNMMHDIWYHYGFDIESGAFQEKHYIRANATGAGDPVHADAQDGALLNDDNHINNANFTAPPDGNSGRMQMYLWNTFNTPPITINGGPLAGDYNGPLAGFGGDYPDETPITADLVLVVDDNSGGTSTDVNDACDVITNAAELAGKIAILRRGECEFGVKLLAAENAGAIAVIVVTDDREVTIMGAGAVGDTVTIPGVMVNKADGDAIIAELNNSNTVNVTLASTVSLRDGDFSNLVVAHEYGHGISIRLTGGADTSGCLNNNEQMGEGWSDWFALMVTMKPGDLGDTPRTIFNYIQPSGTSFTRRSPYSNDFAVNNYTYAGTNDNTIVGTDSNGDDLALNAIVHYIGFVWATTLWDLSWAYVDKYGFDPDLYNGTGGNNKVMQIVMDGLKLQPCGPGYVDGRNAILAADMALTGGEDQCLIWEVFAARGLGFAASQGDPESMIDQVEDFTMPDPADASLANCTTLSSTDFKSSDYSIYPNPASSLVTIKTKKDLGDVTLKLVDINGREVLTKRTTLIGEVSLNVSGLQSGLYILNIKGDYINTNEKIVIK